MPFAQSPVSHPLDWISIDSFVHAYVRYTAWLGSGNADGDKFAIEDEKKLLGLDFEAQCPRCCLF